MSTLHTVNKSPYERNALTAVSTTPFRAIRILLIEDGVSAPARAAALPSRSPR